MEKLLLHIKPKYYFVVAFVLSAITMYMFLSYAQMLSTGKYVILDGDLLETYIPYIKMFLRDISRGESLWFSWSVSMGMNTSLVYAYYVLSPFNLFYLLPMNATVVTALVIILKTGLSAAIFQKFVSKTFQNNGIETIVFALFYSLCGYQVVYNVINIIWMDALYLLPLICLLLFTFCKTKKWIPLVLGYALMFVIQFYTAYMVGIFSAVYFIFLLIMQENRNKKEMILMVAKYLGSVILAIGIAAIVILPAAMFLIGNNPEDASSFGRLNITILEIYNNLFWGEMQDLNGVYPYIYCGIPSLLLLPFFFTNKEVSRKERIGFGALLIFLALCMTISPLYQWMHAFDAPDSFGYRFSFLVSFLLATIACRQAKYIKGMKQKFLYLFAIVNILIYSLEQQLQTSTINSLTGNSSIKLLVNVGFMALWILIAKLISIGKVKKLTLAVCVISLTVVECGTNAYACLYKNEDTMPQVRQNPYELWSSSAGQVVKTIQEEDSDIYRMEYYSDFIHNSDSWFGYMGVSDFSTAENPALRKTMAKIGFFTSPRLTYQHGTTPVTKMLLGIRYQINGINPYTLSEDIPDATYERNETALSFGYLVKEDILNFSFPGENVFENMNALVSDMTGEEIQCFQEIPQEEVFFETENLEVAKINGQTILKRQISSIPSSVIYRIPIDNRQAFAQFESEMNHNSPTAPILIGGNENTMATEGRLSSSYAKEMQANEDFYMVTVRLDQTTDQETKIGANHFAYFDEGELLKAFAILEPKQMEITEFANSYIKANIDVVSDEYILFTSIPYDEGWSVMANGIPVKSCAVLDGAFLAVPLEQGEYELTFQYAAPGSKAGAIISISALIVLFIFGGFECIQHNRKFQLNKKNK